MSFRMVQDLPNGGYVSWPVGSHMAQVFDALGVECDVFSFAYDVDTVPVSRFVSALQTWLGDLDNA